MSHLYNSYHEIAASINFIHSSSCLLRLIVSHKYWICCWVTCSLKILFSRHLNKQKTSHTWINVFSTPDLLFYFCYLPHHLSEQPILLRSSPHSSDSLMELKATESNNDLKKKKLFSTTSLSYFSFHFSYFTQPWLPKSFSSAISSKSPHSIDLSFQYFSSFLLVILFSIFLNRSRRLPINIYTT